VPLGFARSAIDHQISEAVVLYYGANRRSGSFPAAVLERFGPDTGEALITRIQLIQSEIFARPPDWENEDLLGAVKRARAAATELHPELSTDAIKSLGNYFAFEWK
jgi:hypothetical protein